MEMFDNDTYQKLIPKTEAYLDNGANWEFPNKPVVQQALSSATAILTQGASETLETVLEPISFITGCSSVVGCVTKAFNKLAPKSDRFKYFNYAIPIGEFRPLSGETLEWYKANYPEFRKAKELIYQRRLDANPTYKEQLRYEYEDNVI